MRDFEIRPELDKILKKLYKKDRNLHDQITNKINEVVNSYDIEHYKNLRYSMKDCKRVHIGHHVLIFSYVKVDDLVSFEDFNHHDNIYKK